MSGPRIALLGEALVDIFADGEVAGGAPFNVARNLAALGVEPMLVTRLGSDAAGAGIEREMRALGMNLTGVQRDVLRATGRVQVQEGRDGQPSFDIARDAAWDELDTDQAQSAVATFAPSLLYFGTLAQRDPRSRLAIRAVAAHAKVRRLLDLNLRGIDDEAEVAAASLMLADLVKVNAAELDMLLDWFVESPLRKQGLDVAVKALLRRFDVERLVVTRGGDGWACFGRDGEQLHGSAGTAVDVRDTVGAGDAFASVMLLGEAHAWPLSTTLARADMFARAVCTLRGAFDVASPIYAAARAGWQSGH